VRGSATTEPAYPRARKDSVIDDYHGVKVPDPYRWLEDADSNETLAWVTRQNKLTDHFLSAGTPGHQIKRRLTELWNYPKYSAPAKRGGRYFFWKNDGLQNQSVLYRQKTLESEPRVVINPNLLSADGTTAVTTHALSKDGRLLAYGLSSSGSDWQQVMVRNIDSNLDYDETIKWCRFASVAWKHDNEGFFYDRFPEPTTTAAYTGTASARPSRRTSSSTNTPTTRNWALNRSSPKTESSSS
jgi:prolyl oligopeptidase